MSTAALATVSPKTQSGRVVRFPAKAVAKPPSAGRLLNGFVMPSRAEREAGAKLAAEILPGLLTDLETPPVGDAARARLEKLIARRGSETVTLLIRAIIESEGNQGALIEPVIGAVDQVMIWRPKWPERGLSWIEAFDSVPPQGIVAVMRDLDLFREESIERHLSMILHNKLMKVLDPPAPPQRPKPGPKTGQKHNRNTPRYTKAGSLTASL